MRPLYHVMDADLAWIDEVTERDSIDVVHASLKAELDDWPTAFPADMTHDINVARFLRGHGQSRAKATTAMLAAVRYRMELMHHPAVAAMRAAIGQSTFAEQTVLPHFDEIQFLMPNRCVCGATRDGLPLSISPLRQLKLELVQAEELDDKLDLFLRCMLEQRALVLHNLSIEQRRMAKYVEIRDFNSVWISEIVARGKALLGKMKRLIGTVQSYYPEVALLAAVQPSNS